MIIPVKSTTPAIEEYAPHYAPAESSGVETALMSLGFTEPPIAGGPARLLAEPVSERERAHSKPNKGIFGVASDRLGQP